MTGQAFGALVAQRWRTRRAREAEAQAVEVTTDEHRQQLLAVLQEAEADTAAWRVTGAFSTRMSISAPSSRDCNI